MISRFKKVGRDVSGQSAVEFALVLPLFILMVVTIVEFGRLWMTVNVMTSAAREGARVAAVSRPDYSLVNSAAQSVLAASQISGATVNLSGPNSSGDVRVTVSLVYTSITGNIIPRLRSLQLTRTSTMHWED
ncbi:MAG TPA: TadE/TadG family type IV pilus assembly protein [bacterium]|nr:TadE/TadG family type IV pilus assembly protein [bacterium]HQG44715.1 TadE/TadG family type IV pilus assembly protein [bacterium]HQI49614.1 TadE/TadG family type IV pilus assembly protein [bacterium]HQJ63949.1 TadE/TadG family type IV pilus assembly protein [bacterium]